MPVSLVPSCLPIGRATQPRHHRIPLYESLIQCGFTSPATDFIEKMCNLHDLCVTNEEATFFARATGDSMIEAGIEPGSLLVVDASLEARAGDIVVAWYDNEFTCKYIRFAPPLTVLVAANPKYTPIYVQPDDALRICGVVTYILKKPIRL